MPDAVAWPIALAIGTASPRRQKMVLGFSSGHAAAHRATDHAARDLIRIGCHLMRGRRFLILIITFSLLAPASAGAGYTHYWTWNQEPSRLALKSLITECLRVAEARADILEIEKRSPDMIVFNGIGDDAHEPFR